MVLTITVNVTLDLQLARKQIINDYKKKLTINLTITNVVFNNH